MITGFEQNHKILIDCFFFQIAMFYFWINHLFLQIIFILSVSLITVFRQFMIHFGRTRVFAGKCIFGNIVNVDIYNFGFTCELYLEIQEIDISENTYCKLIWLNEVSKLKSYLRFFNPPSFLKNDFNRKILIIEAIALLLNYFVIYTFSYFTIHMLI